jgi:hypothetical protein
MKRILYALLALLSWFATAQAQVNDDVWVTFRHTTVGCRDAQVLAQLLKGTGKTKDCWAIKESDGAVKVYGVHNGSQGWLAQVDFPGHSFTLWVPASALQAFNDPEPEDDKGASSGGSDVSCRTSDFEIKQLDLTEIVRAAQAAIVVGEIVSHCAEPAYPRLQTTVRALDGRVLATVSGAIDISNIEPGDSAPFRLTLIGKFDGLTIEDVSVTSKIVSVGKW